MKGYSELPFPRKEGAHSRNEERETRGSTAQRLIGDREKEFK